MVFPHDLDNVTPNSNPTTNPNPNPFAPIPTTDFVQNQLFTQDTSQTTIPTNEIPQPEIKVETLNNLPAALTTNQTVEAVVISRYSGEVKIGICSDLILDSAEMKTDKNNDSYIAIYIGSSITNNEEKDIFDMYDDLSDTVIQSNKYQLSLYCPKVEKMVEGKTQIKEAKEIMNELHNTVRVVFSQFIIHGLAGANVNTKIFEGVLKAKTQGNAESIKNPLVLKDIYMDFCKKMIDLINNPNTIKLPVRIKFVNNKKGYPKMATMNFIEPNNVPLASSILAFTQYEIDNNLHRAGVITDSGAKKNEQQKLAASQDLTNKLKSLSLGMDNNTFTQ